METLGLRRQAYSYRACAVTELRTTLAATAKTATRPSLHSTVGHHEFELTVACFFFGPFFFRIVHDVQTRQTIDVLGLDTGTLQLGQILALSIAEPCSQPRGNAVPFQALPP